ncbi:MAG: hypothetical protein ABI859_19235, partial [Pseudomonadota bacterium]
MTQERTGGKIISVLLLGALLSGCSQPAATAATPTAAAAAAAAAPEVTGAPPVTTTGFVRGLPDFSALVERFGPAVVNVQVTEKRPEVQTQNRGPQGMSPNDPFYDFFRRFGIPNPNGQG